MHSWHYTPACDLGLTPTERVKCVRREPGLFACCMQRMFWATVRVYLRLWHRIEISGHENLPEDTPFVIVANHTSHLDALVLGAFLPRTLRGRVFPISAGDTFFAKRSIGWFASLCLNALPLWRRRAGAHALTDLRTRLIAGKAGYIMFPEGTRSRDGQLGEFKPGIGMLVAGTDVPVIPCLIEGAFSAWPSGSSLPRPRKLALRVGEPLIFRDLADNREDWNTTANRASECVATLGTLPGSAP